MPIKTTGYECPACNRVYKETKDAKSCCPVDRIEAWRCQFCGYLFTFEDDAKDHERFFCEKRTTCKGCAHCDAEGHRWPPCPKHHFAHQDQTCGLFAEATT